MKEITVRGYMARLPDESAKALNVMSTHLDWNLHCYAGAELLAEEMGKSREAFYYALRGLRIIPGFQRVQEKGRSCHTYFSIEALTAPIQFGKNAVRKPASTLRPGVHVHTPQALKKPNPRGVRNDTQSSRSEVVKPNCSSRNASKGQGSTPDSGELSTATTELDKRGIDEDGQKKILDKWGLYPDVFRAVLKAWDKKSKGYRTPGLLVHMFDKDAPKILAEQAAKAQTKRAGQVKDQEKRRQEEAEKAFHEQIRKQRAADWAAWTSAERLRWLKRASQSEKITSDIVRAKLLRNLQSWSERSKMPAEVYTIFQIVA